MGLDEQWKTGCDTGYQEESNAEAEVVVHGS
jgi:hypothetical protein